MRLATVCSGIGTAELIGDRLGWESVFASEIDLHACSVLQHHYPKLPNLGNMLDIDGRRYRGTTDILIGGTPCVSFSMAGKRKGLADKRSALALRYIQLLAEIRPKYFCWENVQGALSCNGGRDFARFLGCITGRGILPPTKWRTAGIIRGYKSAYSIAYRVLDAKHFGCAQRRSRVFVVGYLGDDWRPPAAVLFNGTGMQGFAAPSQKSSRDCDPLSESPLISFSSKDRLTDVAIELAPTLRSGSFTTSHANGGIPPAIATPTMARMLTPIETERLQGLPDNYTNVLHNNKPMKNGPRYKLCGNAIAVPVLQWIMGRIERVEAIRQCSADE